MTVHSTGLDRMTADLDRLSRAPSQRTKERLDAALDATFADAQERVGVLSGSLRASGQTDSHVEHSEWHGEMTWAENSKSAEYAIYHLADNDWLAGTHAHEPLFEAAINGEVDDL